MSNFFYVYSDLNKAEVHYGFAKNKPEISFQMLINGFIETILDFLIPQTPSLPFYTKLFKSGESLIYSIIFVFKVFCKSLYFYIWLIVLVVLIYLNYKIYMRYKNDFSKLRLLRQNYNLRKDSKSSKVEPKEEKKEYNGNNNNESSSTTLNSTETEMDSDSENNYSTNENSSQISDSKIHSETESINDFFLRKNSKSLNNNGLKSSKTENQADPSSLRSKSINTKKITLSNDSRTKSLNLKSKCRPKESPVQQSFVEKKASVEKKTSAGINPSDSLNTKGRELLGKIKLDFSLEYDEKKCKVVSDPNEKSPLLLVFNKDEKQEFNEKLNENIRKTSISEMKTSLIDRKQYLIYNMSSGDESENRRYSSH